jgi:prevent-host-death family protein
MRTVSAREANQGFSKLLQAVAGGEEVVITRRGKPVARMAPIEPPSIDEHREKEIAAIIEHFREGVELDTSITWTRDELYER